MREENGAQDVRNFLSALYFLHAIFPSFKVLKKFTRNAEIRYWVIQEVRLLKCSHIEITLSVNGYVLFVGLFLNVFLNQSREQEKTISKSKILEKGFRRKKSQFSFLLEKKNLILHLSLCSWKCVFAGFLEALIYNILLKENNRETKFSHNVFHIR